MSKIYYKARHIILKDHVLENRYMGVEDGKITDFTKDPKDEKVVDLGDVYLAPGLVDTHIHGFKNKDVMDCEPGALNIISKGLLENGVTSFLPTTLTAANETLNRAVELIGEEYEDVEGAKVRGIFLEGPYFTEKHKGAQNTAYMSDPKIDELKKWKELSKGLVRKIAIAPERDGVPEFVKQAREMGVYVALGHSDATYDQAKAACDAGATIFVHTYNGMRGLHHREPGMVGAALTMPNAYAELICDGHHVHPAAAQVVMNARGKDRTVLITDCMMAGGMPEGNYMLGEFPVVVKDGAARIENGSLAGSILRLNQAVQNVVDWDIATVFEAVQMASKVPAESVGIDDVCGILDVGREADFVVFDEGLNVKQTYLDGELKYEA